MSNAVTRLSGVGTGGSAAVHRVGIQERPYDSFHWKYNIPEIHQIEKLRLRSISQYKFKIRSCFNLNL